VHLGEDHDQLVSSSDRTAGTDCQHDSTNASKGGFEDLISPGEGMEKRLGKIRTMGGVPPGHEGKGVYHSWEESLKFPRKSSEMSSSCERWGEHQVPEPITTGRVG